MIVEKSEAKKNICVLREGFKTLSLMILLSAGVESPWDNSEEKNMEHCLVDKCAMWEKAKSPSISADKSRQWGYCGLTGKK